MATPRDAYRRAMRDELLGAAQRVLDRKGFSGLTIRDVLAEAEVAPGTLYSYFTGKEELLAEMARRALADVMETVVAGAETPPRQVLTSLLEMALLAPMEGAAVLAAMRGAPGGAGHTELVRSFNAEVVAGMRPLFEQAEGGNGKGGDDLDALVELLDIVWDGLTRRAASGTLVTTYERVGGLLLEMLRSRLELAV